MKFIISVFYSIYKNIKFGFVEFCFVIKKKNQREELVKSFNCLKLIKYIGRKVLYFIRCECL